MEFLLVNEMGLANVTIFQDSTDIISRVEAIHPPPDIILLDIHMQPYSGFEVLEMLRAHQSFKDTPVIALTASVMNEEIAKLKTSGFNSIIPKPIDQDTFPDFMHRVLKGESIWRVVY